MSEDAELNAIGLFLHVSVRPSDDWARATPCSPDTQMWRLISSGKCCRSPFRVKSDILDAPAGRRLSLRCVDFASG
jgi:hypothetical protein